MPEYLETTVDRFTFRVAKDRLYTPQGAWIFWMKPEAPDRVHIGLPDYLQQRSGDVAFATVKPAGTKLGAGEMLAEIETIKAMVELAWPVSGTVAEVNPALDTTPEVINQDPNQVLRLTHGVVQKSEPGHWGLHHVRYGNARLVHGAGGDIEIHRAKPNPPNKAPCRPICFQNYPATSLVGMVPIRKRR